MPVNKPIELKIFIVISEGIDQLFSNLQQAHVEEELEDSEDRDVEIDIQWDSTTWHPFIFSISFQFLSSNDGEDEEDVGGQCDDLPQ